MNPSTDLTIVGHASNGYGRFLGDWADSIIGLTVQPAAVHVLTHGPAGDDIPAKDAVARLSGAGIPATHEHVAELMHVAEAKNRVVAATSTPWVMNLDADDTLLPHALTDVAALADKADIVALGYERCGEVNGKPRTGKRLYHTAVGLGIVKRGGVVSYPASGNWPFRRSLWEQRPYRTELDGAWDTASLLDWAHLGARTVATTRPCFRYMRRSDSVLSLRQRNPALLHRTNKQIHAIHHAKQPRVPLSPLTRFAVIVPRERDALPLRAKRWDWLKRRYETLHPDWPVVEGFAVGGAAWCKAAAIDDALRHTDADGLIVADADCVVSPESLAACVQMVQSGAVGWAMPHGGVYRLNRAVSDTVSAGPVDAKLPTGPLERAMHRGVVGGGIVVCRREDWTRIAHLLSGFIGWGGEDVSLGRLLTALSGAPYRHEAKLIHLAHEVQPTRGANIHGSQQNSRLTATIRTLTQRGRMAVLNAPHPTAITRPTWHRAAQVQANSIAARQHPQPTAVA